MTNFDGKRKKERREYAAPREDLFQALLRCVRTDFIEGLARFVIGLLLLGTSFSGISKLGLSFCSFSDCELARASVFFICWNSEDGIA